MKTLSNTGSIDQRGTMYSSKLELLENAAYSATPYSTVYGFVLEGTVYYKSYILEKNHWFSCKVGSGQDFKIVGKAILIERLGYQGQDTTGGPLEELGRLTYIDGCSDSLLVYPPRQGDPSLNALYFPPGVDQSFHIHPSIRLGVVVKGRGYCNLKDKEIELNEGDAFCLETMELHRFRTTDSEMVVIAYHPDGDWGPTDHNHTMLNRTYLK